MDRRKKPYRATQVVRKARGCLQSIHFCVCECDIITSILDTRNVNSSGIIFAEHGIEVLAATYVYISFTTFSVVLTMTYTHFYRPDSE